MLIKSSMWEKYTTTIIPQPKQCNPYCTCDRSSSAESKQVREASRSTFILLLLVIHLIGEEGYLVKSENKNIKSTSHLATKIVMQFLLIIPAHLIQWLIVLPGSFTLHCITDEMAILWNTMRVDISNCTHEDSSSK